MTVRGGGRAREKEKGGIAVRGEDETGLNLLLTQRK